MRRVGSRAVVRWLSYGYVPGLLLIVLYCWVSPHIIWRLEAGTLGSAWREVATEGPLLLLAFYALTRPLARGVRSTLVVTGVILTVYVIHDAHYAKLNTVPDFRDVALIPELVRIAGWPVLVWLLLVSLPVVVWVRNWNRERVRELLAPHVPTAYGVPAAAGFTLALLFAFSPERYVALIRHATPREGLWSAKTEVEANGRLWSAAIRDAEHRMIAAANVGFTPPDSSGYFWSSRVTGALEPRNVYIVMLESFIDPTTMARVRFSEPPWTEEFRTLVDGHVNVSLSPGVTGATAMSEFEVLCGVPALQLNGVDDFFALTGHPTVCLPEQLRAQGYRTLALDAGPPQMYNRRKAYRSLGFEKVAYRPRYATLGDDVFSDGNDPATFIRDGYLFDDVVARAATGAAGHVPTLTFVMTIYGHDPFPLDTAAQPAVVTTDARDAVLDRIANLAWYRTKALAAFFEQLDKHDPAAVVVVATDHLPPLGVQRFRTSGYAGRVFANDERGLRETPLLVRNRGEFLNLPPMRHFEVTGVIYNLLTNGAYCRDVPKACDYRAARSPAEEFNTYVDPYRTVIGLGSTPLPAGSRRR